MQNFISNCLLLSLALVLGACSEQAAEPVPQDPKLVEGEMIYKGNCKVCHVQGINGAPIPGNEKMWGVRAQQDLSTLVQHASKGFGLMPAKGGNAALTDQQLELAINYMLSLLENDKQ